METIKTCCPTTKLKKQQLLTLKAKIKGLAEGGIRCRKFIGATSHDARSRHWDEKRSIGLPIVQKLVQGQC